MENEKINTPTIQPEETPQDDFSDILDIQAAQSAAQRIVEQSYPAEVSTLESPPTYEQPAVSARVKHNRAVATGAAVLVSGTALATGFAVGAAALEGPTFSEDTKTYTVEDGDGLYNAAEQIEGVNSIDIRDAVTHIETAPVNLDVLKDGLQVGEQIEIPVSVEGHENDQ